MDKMTIEDFLKDEDIATSIKQELLKAGLDFDDNNFINCDKYKDFKNKLFIIDGLDEKVSYDFYIEKYMLSEERLLKMKKGKFDIGVNRDVNKKDITKVSLINEIFEEGYAHKSEVHINDEEWESKTKAMIKQRLYDDESGLIKKLKNRLNFDIKLFDESQEYSGLKLLKLLYRFEKAEGKSKGENITNILFTPSLENVDNSSAGIIGKYGLLITELKNEVRKEIGVDYERNVRFGIRNICFLWQEMLQMAEKMIFSESISKEQKTEELIRINTQLIQQLKELNINYTFDTRLMESFYLKLNQLDQISLLENLSRSTHFLLNSINTQYLLKNDVPQDYKLPFIRINDFLDYFKENTRYVTSLVFKSDITDSDIKRIFENIELVNILYEKYSSRIKNYDYVGYGSNKTLLFLVSALEEIILTKEKGNNVSENSFKNRYYANERSERTLRSILLNMLQGDSYEEIYDIIWISKIKIRIFWHIGLLKECCLLDQIGLQINDIMCYIFSISNYRDMSKINQLLLDELVITKKHTIGEYEQMFKNDIMNTTGFNCELASKKIFKHFDNDGYKKYLTETISDVIRNLSSNPNTNKSICEIVFGEDDYKMNFSVDTQTKIFELNSFEFGRVFVINGGV